MLRMNGLRNVMLPAFVIVGLILWGVLPGALAQDAEPISAGQWQETTTPISGDLPAPIQLAQQGEDTSPDPLVTEAETMDDESVPDEVADEFADEPDIFLDQESAFNAFDVDQIQLQELQSLNQEISDILTARELTLTLQECVHLALANNQDILIINYEPSKAFGDLVAARGDFDPVLTGAFNWTDVRQSANPQTVAFGGVTTIENYTTTAELGLQGVLPWGTQYGVSGNIEYEEGTFSQFIGQYNSRLTLTLTQPLLRGFGLGSNLANIRRARNAVSVSQAQVMTQVLDTIGQVMKAYWDLVGTIKNLEVRKEALANAERVVEINEKRLEIGMAAPIEVLQARAGVAPRITDLVTARQAIADAGDNLKFMLSMREGDYLSGVQIMPLDEPSDFDFDWDDRRSMKLALEYRPEIQSQELAIDSATLNRRRARTELLPQLDLSLNRTYGGRDTRLEETFNGLRRKQDEVTTIGITGSFPLFNRAGRGQYHRAKLEVIQEEQRLEQTKNNLMLNVRLAGRAVVANKLIIESSELNVQLQETNVLAEEERLRLGASTNQQVLEIQEDLTQAEVDLLVARVNTEKALVDLRVAEGTLLKEFGINYELPEIERPLNSIDSFQDRDNTWRKNKYREMGLLEE